MPPQPLTDFLNTLTAFLTIVLETIHQAQELRVQQVHKIISQHSYIAQLDIWDVEATLLSIKKQQAAASQNRQGIGHKHLTTILHNYQGKINRLVLNSTQILNQQQLERSIPSAAQQGYEQIRNLQRVLPFPYLATI
jgi:hypothetical protein